MNLLRHAKNYRKLGWSLIPVGQDKRPRFPWQKYQTTRPTYPEIETWFKHDQSGLALICGEVSGIVVVDVDTAQPSVAITSPLVATTQGGGKHYYFRWDRPVPPSVNSELAIDVRGDGSYVVLPPSQGYDGSYQWDSVTNLTQLPALLRQLTPLPAALLGEIAEPLPERTLGPLTLDMGIGEGSRNETLHRRAVSLLSKFTEGEAWSMVEAMNATFQPPLPTREVQSLYESARKFVAAHPPHRTSRPQVLKPVNDRGTIPTMQSLINKTKTWLREGDPLGFPTGYTELDQIIGGLKPGETYLLYADTNVGKTVFMHNIAVRMAQAGLRTVYFDLENRIQRSLQRQIMITFGLAKEEWATLVKDDPAQLDVMLDEMAKLPLYIWDLTSLNERFGEVTYSVFDRCYTEAVEEGARVFFLDHLHYFSPSEENHEELAHLAKMLNDKAAKDNTVIVMLAHTKKGLQHVDRDEHVIPRRPIAEDVRGSSLITKHTKNLLGLKRQTEGLPEDLRRMWVYVSKTKHGETGIIEVAFDPSTLQVRGLDVVDTATALTDGTLDL